MDKNELITTRDFAPGDHNFILATFLRGLFYGDSWFSMIPKNLFMASYHPVVERLLKSGATVKIACLKDSPDVILGYAIYRKLLVAEQPVTVLDWCFVKSAWRKVGIAKSLIPAKVHAVSHLTKTGKSLLPKIGAIFNPWC